MTRTGHHGLHNRGKSVQWRLRDCLRRVIAGAPDLNGGDVACVKPVRLEQLSGVVRALARAIVVVLNCAVRPDPTAAGVGEALLEDLGALLKEQKI